MKIKSSPESQRWLCCSSKSQLPEKESTSVISVFGVLYTKILTIYLKSSAETDDYGNEKLEVLIEYHGNDQETQNGVAAAVIDGPACRREYVEHCQVSCTSAEVPLW